MTAETPLDLDQVQQRLVAFEEFLRWRELMLHRYADQDIDQQAAVDLERATDDSADQLLDPDQLGDVDPPGIGLPDIDSFRSAQKALLRHPVAAQAGFRALAAEGRRFAETEDGREWRARIEGSPALERLRMLWESLSLTMVDEDPGAMLPSAFLELFVRTAATGELDDIATELGLPFLNRKTAQNGVEDQSVESQHPERPAAGQGQP